MFTPLLLVAFAPAADPTPLPVAAGFRGIWYMNQPTKDEFKYKYSGGMATYPQQHAPMAVYSKAADRTFFVFGGVADFPPAKPELLHMVAYYDHKTGTVSRPRVLLNKKTADAHDNPVLSLDAAGHLWVFSPSHGTARPSFVHRSTKPHSIDAFERVWDENFSYPQPWHLSDRGFLFLHTRYKGGRRLFWTTSRDGREWSDPRPLAHIDMGDYQVSWRHRGKVGTAFDHHPKPLGLNARTNLYYLETADGGATWTAADGKAATLPLSDPKNPALVKDFQAEGKLVYLKDVNFDADGKPVVLFLTTGGYAPGPKAGPREWQTARWTGAGWELRPFTTSDHNYDHGSLSVEPDGSWRVVATTDPGPQPHGTGGDVVLWQSKDRGTTWARVKALTGGGPRNHNYPRRPLDAHPDFHALWADGDALAPSESRLYFCTRDGAVFRLPAVMDADAARPEPVPVK